MAVTPPYDNFRRWTLSTAQASRQLVEASRQLLAETAHQTVTPALLSARAEDARGPAPAAAPPETAGDA